MHSQHSGAAAPKLDALDPVWTTLREEAQAIVVREPVLAGLVYANILNHERLEDALAHRIAARLDHAFVGADILRRGFSDMFRARPDLSEALRADLVAVMDRD